MRNFQRRFSGLRTRTMTCSRPIPNTHLSTSRRLAECGQSVLASIFVPSLSRMAQTSFGFGLVTTASMTESLLVAAGDSKRETWFDDFGIGSPIIQPARRDARFLLTALEAEKGGARAWRDAGGNGAAIGLQDGVGGLPIGSSKTSGRIKSKGRAVVGLP